MKKLLGYLDMVVNSAISGAVSGVVFAAVVHALGVNIIINF